MMKNVNILIVEDDVLISEHLKMILEDLGFTVLSVCASYAEAVNALDKITPDFAFLDIRMNGVDEGIEVAKVLNNKEVPFVFVTSFSDKETLMDAVMQKPLGYILKPFFKEDVQKVLEKANDFFQNEYLEIGNSQKLDRIKIQDILWLKSDNVYVEVICKSSKYLAREKLNEVHKKLPQNQFLRTNQSYVVNVLKIESLFSSNIVIAKTEIPLSKKYRKNVFESITQN